MRRTTADRDDRWGALGRDAHLRGSRRGHGPRADAREPVDRPGLPLRPRHEHRTRRGRGDRRSGSPGKRRPAEPRSHSRTPPKAGKEKPRLCGRTRTAGKITHSVPRARRGASEMWRRRGDDVLGTRHAPTLPPARMALKDDKGRPGWTLGRRQDAGAVRARPPEAAPAASARRPRSRGLPGARELVPSVVCRAHRERLVGAAGELPIRAPVRLEDHQTPAWIESPGGVPVLPSTPTLR